MKLEPAIFRDYDIRAVIPDQLDMEGVKRIGEATLAFFKPKKVAIGYDARLTGPQIYKTLTELFLNLGTDVVHLGQISTDMSYFAAGRFGFDLTIMITASHNPPEYNGFKMTLKGGESVSGPSGFYQIRDLALSSKKLVSPAKTKGQLKTQNLYKDWIDFCFSLVNVSKIKPFKVVIDAGNGIGGQLFSHPHLTHRLPVKIIPLYFEPDGRFPNHIPNPLKPENLVDLIKKVKEEKADVGVALDGDGDRIAFVTETGKFVSGTVVTALIAERLLEKNPGATILYNAVCGRIVPETVKRMGGKSQRVRVGYSLIKPEMKKTGAIFAGEHSCHYFYKENYNSEASLLTFLLILEALSSANQPFSQLVAQYDKYPTSGEINFEVEDKKKVMKAVADFYQDKAKSIDWLDGVTVWFEDSWINLRPSNTQPLLRLNIEADDEKTLNQRKKEVIDFILSQGAKLSAE